MNTVTKFAILNANYISKRLEDYFPTVYRGHGGLVAHECILDLRRIVAGGRRTGVAPVSNLNETEIESQARRLTCVTVKSVTAEDVAKRLRDYQLNSTPHPNPLPVRGGEGEVLVARRRHAHGRTDRKRIEIRTRPLPELPSEEARKALNDLLVRIRVHGLSRG